MRGAPRPSRSDQLLPNDCRSYTRLIASIRHSMWRRPMTTDTDTKARSFRALHERDGAFVIPNPWDVGTARILASMGFEALATTSAGFAFSLGLPDGAITRDQALAHCRDIVAATELPVSADLEGGFVERPRRGRRDGPPRRRHRTRRLLDRGRHGRPRRADLRFRDGGRAHRRGGRGGARVDARLRAHRAPRTICTAGATSTTRSAACRPSRRPAPTSSTRRACPTSTPSGRSVRRSAGRSMW